MPYLISKALRYGPCVIKRSQFYLPPTHEPFLPPFLPSRKASPPFSSWGDERFAKQALESTLHGQRGRLWQPRNTLKRNIVKEMWMWTSGTARGRWRRQHETEWDGDKWCVGYDSVGVTSGVSGMIQWEWQVGYDSLEWWSSVWGMIQWEWQVGYDAFEWWSSVWGMIQW